MRHNANPPEGAPTSRPKPDPVVVMADFDALPPDARAVLRDAVFDWDPGSFLAALHRRGNLTGLGEYVAAFEAQLCRRVA